MLTNRKKSPSHKETAICYSLELLQKQLFLEDISYFKDSATATATATVAPTMGLLPMPRKPIISTEETAFGGFLIGAQGFQKK